MNKRNYKVISLFIALILFMQIFILGGNIGVEADENPLRIEKSVNKSQVVPGEIFIYTINYQASSIKDNYTNVKVEDALPEGVEFVSLDRSTHIESDNWNYNEDTNTLEVQLTSSGDTLNAGVTGNYQINVRVTEGIYGNGQIFTNQAVIYSDTVSPSATNTVDVETTGVGDYWETRKTKTYPSANPVPGSDVKYKVEIVENVPADSANINIKKINLVDKLPTGAAFISAENGGVYNTTEHAVYWDINELNVGSIFSAEVKINLSEENFKVGDNFTNTLSASALDFFDNSVDIKGSNITLEVSEPSYSSPSDSGFYKNAAYKYRTLGQEQWFRLGNIKHTGNTEVKNFMVIDEVLPQELDYTKINLPNYSEDNDYIIEVKNSSGSWISTSRSALGKDEVTIGELGINSGNLYGLKINYGTVPADFNAGYIYIYGYVNTSSPLNVTNEAVFSYTYGTTDAAVTDSTVFEIIGDKPWIEVEKSIIGDESYNPKDTVTFKIEVSNPSKATGVLKNPKVIDVLPEMFYYVSGSAVVSGIDTSGMAFTSTDVAITDTIVGDLDNSKDRYNLGGILGEKLTRSAIASTEMLIWEWTGEEIPVGGNFFIEYEAQIDKYTPYTKDEVSYKNGVYATSLEHLSNGFLWGDGNDEWDTFKEDIHYSPYLDEYFSDSVYLVPDFQEVNVNRSSALEIKKYNKGDLDDEFTTYPNTGQAVEGGKADYKLELTNVGNAVIKNIDIIDILPYIGDEAILNSTARESEWRPNLISPLREGNLSTGAVNYDLDVDYSISSDKNVVELIRIEPSDLEQWMDQIPDDFDITSIKTLYFQINNINDGDGLDSGETIEINWSMRAPVGTPGNKTAWNSVATEVQLYDGEYLLKTEPIKVGFEVLNDIHGQIGNYVWFDSNKDGIQNDGYDEEEAGINGIRAKLYFENTTGETIFVDETLTADDYDGNPGYYLFPNLTSTKNTGKYYVVFEIPDIYDITSKDATDETTTEVTLDSDGNTIYVENSKRYSKTDYIELEYREDYSYPYRQLNWDLGLIGSSQAEASGQLTKSALVGPYNVGETVNYSFQFKNTGTVPIHNINISDEMDRSQSGFEFTEVGLSTTNMSIVEESLLVDDIINDSNFTVLKLNPGETLYFNGEYTVTQDDVSTTSALENTVTINANELVDPLTDSESVDIADISIKKEADKTVIEPGVDGYNIANYTVTVVNNSNITLENIVVKDPMITKSSLTTTSNIVEDEQGVKVLNMTPGQEEVVNYTYTSAKIDLGSVINNTAEVIHNDIRNTTKSDQIKVDTLGLEVNKEEISEGPYKVGDQIDYKITIKNLGTSDIKDVYYIDRLYNKEGASSFTVLDNSTIAAIEGGEEFTKNIPYILTQEDIDVLNNSDLINTIEVTSDEINSDPLTDQAVKSTYDIQLTKSGQKAENEFLEIGSEVLYTFTIKNTGSKTLNNIELNDSRIGYSTSISSIEPGNTIEKQFTYTVVENDLKGIIKNTAQVSTSEGAEDSDWDIVGDSDIKIIKNVVKSHNQKDNIISNYNSIIGSNSITTNRNSEVTYIFTVVNTGDTVLKNISISDSALGVGQGDMTFIPELSDSSSFSWSTTLSAAEGRLVFYYEDLSKGNFTNTAKTEGTPSYESGEIITELEKVSDNDSANTRIPQVLRSLVGDRLWFDIDKDGKQDSSENGIPNIRVYLKDTSGNHFKTVRTDENGYYLFEDLNPNPYLIEVDNQDILELEVTQTYELDGTFDNSVRVELRGGQDKRDVDFGYYLESDDTTTDEAVETTTEDAVETTTEDAIEELEDPIDPQDPQDPEDEGTDIYETEDPENEIIEVVDPPRSGEVTIEDGKVKYTPDDTYDGEDKIVIKVTKDDGTEEIITIEINEDLIPLEDIVELPDLGVDTHKLLYFVISILSLVALIITRKRITA